MKWDRLTVTRCNRRDRITEPAVAGSGDETLETDGRPTFGLLHTTP